MCVCVNVPAFFNVHFVKMVFTNEDKVIIIFLCENKRVNLERSEKSVACNVSDKVSMHFT